MADFYCTPGMPLGNTQTAGRMYQARYYKWFLISKILLIFTPDFVKPAALKGQQIFLEYL